MQIQRMFIKARHLFSYFTVILFLLSCNKQGPKLIEVKVLNDYPSGSGLAYLEDHIYIIGDDATAILKTDSQFKVVDRTGLFISSQQRIPKDIKADLESIALIKLNKSPAFLLPGSGSLAPYRNVCWIFDPSTKEKNNTCLTLFTTE